MDVKIDICQNLGCIDASSWDALVDSNNPFCRHAYLHGLEHSHCVGAKTGWQPHHLVVRQNSTNTLLAAMPLYIKTDSYGEFIFDWAWADASMRAGLPYYPKLVAAVPYTPATGTRILCKQGVQKEQVAALLHDKIAELMQKLRASSAHVLFCEPNEAKMFGRLGYTPRQSHQFHWHRAPHWHSFDDFLQDLRAPVRKQIKKERRLAQSHGLTLSFRDAQDVSEEDMTALYLFYRQTIWEKGAQAYLSAAFYASLREFGPGRVRVAMAHDGSRAVAGALFFASGEHLYGRYWGCLELYDALHFELCYYMPIAWCIDQRVNRFEAGAQGDHKLKRGLMPNLCHSVHKMAHSGLDRAVAQFCLQEGLMVRTRMQQAAEHGPYHRPHKG